MRLLLQLQASRFCVFGGLLHISLLSKDITLFFPIFVYKRCTLEQETSKLLVKPDACTVNTFALWHFEAQYRGSLFLKCPTYSGNTCRPVLLCYYASRNHPVYFVFGWGIQRCDIYQYNVKWRNLIPHLGPEPERTSGSVLCPTSHVQTKTHLKCHF